MIFLIFQEEISQQLCETTMFSVASTLEPHWFPVDVFRQFFSERFGILKTACSFQQICYLSSVTVVNVNRSTYNQQNSAECFAPTPTKPKIFSGDMPYRFIIGQYRSRFGNGSKKNSLPRLHTKIARFISR